MAGAWLLYLHLEASRHEDRGWASELEPLARAFAARLKDYLAKLTYPIRVGTHFNTAFALILSIEWARTLRPRTGRDHRRVGHREIRRRPRLPGVGAGRRRIPVAGADRGAAAWRASCRARDFADWFAGFLPRLAQGEPATLFTPATVSDRSDGKIAHLDGLNFSRAWCWKAIAPLLEPRAAERADAAARRHFDAALPHVAGDYAGEHWLASFALLAALDSRPSAPPPTSKARASTSPSRPR